MAWSATGRQLPSNWQAIVRLVKARDGHRCTWTQNDGSRCPETTRLEVDHIGNPHDHSPDNLRTLCHWHHAQRTARQASASKRRAPKMRTPEPHPGLDHRGG